MDLACVGLFEDFSWVPIGRILLASILGGLIGLEREIHGRPAGFRTHLLVTIGACLMMLVSEHFYFKYAALDSTSTVRLDPARIAAQIVVGIGFIGAGAIIKEGYAVRGLTTAACLWVAAGVGMAVGAGLYLPALLVSAVALINLLFLKRLERWISKDRYRLLAVVCDDGNGARQKVEAFLEGRGISVVNFAMEKDAQALEVKLEYLLSYMGKDKNGEFVEAVFALPGVKRVRLR